MQDANDHNRIRHGTIKDHVPAVWQAAQLWSKLVTRAAHERMQREQNSAAMNHAAIVGLS